MNLKRDATGHAIWAFFQGSKSTEVIERDDGYIEVSRGPEAYFAEFKDWPKVQQHAIRSAKGKVLDIGAGAARVSLHLQENGLRVVAIDNSPLAIKVCKLRGVRHARLLPVDRIGIFPPGTFDTVIMFGNNFGLLRSFEKSKLILRQLYKITTPDALIIAESVNPCKAQASEHRSYEKLNKKKGRMPGQIRIRIRYRKFVGAWFDYLLVSKSEMKAVLRGTGWRVRRFLDYRAHTYCAIIEKTNHMNRGLFPDSKPRRA